MKWTSFQESYLSLLEPLPRAGMGLKRIPFSMTKSNSPSVFRWVEVSRMSGAGG
ncbi:MAG TPA: hypothetical protein VMU05_10995 [Dongiaceae bacterium]|nr:hypothetical protein [Dongiaceae bacterium]